MNLCGGLASTQAACPVPVRNIHKAGVAVDPEGAAERSVTAQLFAGQLLWISDPLL